MKTIVAAVDFSNATPGVVDAAVQISRALGASMHLLHVLESELSYQIYGFSPADFPAMHSFRDEAWKCAKIRLDELLEKTSKSLPNVTVHIAEGAPLHAVLDYVQKVGADLVILGTHGHGAVAALLLGSVAEGMVRKAVVPVMVIPVREK
jgi:nucleotide-binding universal stress UspA family protein